MLGMVLFLNTIRGEASYLFSTFQNQKLTPQNILCYNDNLQVHVHAETRHTVKWQFSRDGMPQRQPAY